MTINSMDSLVSAFCSSLAQRKPFWKFPATGAKSGFWHSYWSEPGYPVAGSTPTVIGSGGDVPANTTNGALQIATPSGSDIEYLTSFCAEMPISGTGATTGFIIMIADRLWECSGISGTNVSVQNITSPGAITRPDDTGSGAEIWVETYSSPGATAQTLTITYTNSSGSGSRTATANFPASANKYDCQPAILEAGDTGVESIQSVQWGGSTGSASNYGITILRRIAEISSNIAAAGNESDIFYNNMPVINSGACISIFTLHLASTQETLLTGHIRICEG